MRGALTVELNQARPRFLALVADVRPDRHRCCARMTGSVIDGEDIVQETLARAYDALSEVETMPPLRSWLFQIAHQRALDYLRRYEPRMSQPLNAVADTSADNAGDTEDTRPREEAVRAAVWRFLERPPVQCSCVILKDMLGHSVDEIAALLTLTVPAIRAALHRGRAHLCAKPESSPRASVRAAAREGSAAIARAAAMFNARDWNGVRAMLAEDVRFDLVSRVQRSWRGEVCGYVANDDSVPVGPAMRYKSRKASNNEGEFSCPLPISMSLKASALTRRGSW
jgi:RNA polymerase sigma factor (sigma-70 family)